MGGEPDDRRALRADCDRCSALCCVAPAFVASSDFAITKPAATPCQNLATDFRCTIHSGLAERGFPGCVSFDCLGAGPRTAQRSFGGRDWRTEPSIAADMFAVFDVQRQLHELLWYVSDALALPAAGTMRAEFSAARDQLDRLADGTAGELLALDVGALHRRIDPLLVGAAALARAAGTRPAAKRRGRPAAHRRELVRADLIGRDLRRVPLAGADLRGALLIGADLRGVDLRLADLRGADLRAADLRGAKLAHALFLTQFQVNAARGDEATQLPGTLRRPAHWNRSGAVVRDER